MLFIYLKNKGSLGHRRLKKHFPHNTVVLVYDLYVEKEVELIKMPTYAT
jgi:hypothetical protein